MKTTLQSARAVGSAASSVPAQRKVGLKTITDNRPSAIAQRKLQGVVQRKGIIQRVRELDRKDIEGFNSTYETILKGLNISEDSEANSTLIISVGRSPQVLSKYLEKRGLYIVYLPISGLSGKQMPEYDKLNAEQQSNRNAFFKHFLNGKIDNKKTVLTIDIGVSGSSNLAVYKEIKRYLKSNGPDINVKMATISPFQNKGRENTEALQHEDNIFVSNPLDERLSGIHRLMKIQYNSIDKDMAFTDKFLYNKVDEKVAFPIVNAEKEKEINDVLERAIAKYGNAPSPFNRKSMNKPFSGRLLFEKEVNEWRYKLRSQQEDELWREQHPYLARMLKFAHHLAAFSSVTGSLDALAPKYWKHIKV